MTYSVSELQANSRQNSVKKSAFKVGCIVLSTDLTIERDFALLKDRYKAHFDFYINRIEFNNPINSQSLQNLLHQLDEASQQILPGESLDALVFNCTSASALLGERAIKKSISRRGIDILTTAQCCVNEIKKQKVKKLDLLCPYSQQVSQILADYFVKQGLQVEHLYYLGIEDDRDIARISHEQIIELAKKSVSAGSDGLFLSCTAMRVAEIIPEIETTIKRKVLSSNYCTFKQLLSLLENKRG